MKNWTTLMLARAGVIAALYVALTFAVLPVANGLIQFRISEMLTILPLFYIEAVPALFVGCLISNLIGMFTGVTLLDVFLGSAITLFAAVCTYVIGKKFKRIPLKIALGGFFPVALNAFGLPAVWILAGVPDIVYFLEVGFLTLSQGTIIWGLGTGLYVALAALLKKNVSVLQPYAFSTEK